MAGSFALVRRWTLGTILGRERQYDAGPAPQRCFTEFGEAIDTAPGALEPTIYVAEENAAGIGCDFAEITRPPRSRPKRCGKRESLLPIGCHDWLAD